VSFLAYFAAVRGNSTLPLFAAMVFTAFRRWGLRPGPEWGYSAAILG